MQGGWRGGGGRNEGAETPSQSRVCTCILSAFLFLPKLETVYCNGYGVRVTHLLTQILATTMICIYRQQPSWCLLGHRPIRGVVVIKHHAISLTISQWSVDQKAIKINPRLSSSKNEV